MVVPMNSDSEKIYDAKQEEEFRAFFEKTCKCFKGYIRRRIQSIGLSSSEREDLVHDVSSRAYYLMYGQWFGFEPTKGTRSTWLYSMAHWTLLDELKKWKPYLSHRGEWNEERAIEIMLDETDGVVEKMWRDQHLSRLPDTTQEILRLLGEGFTFEEIAKKTGKTTTSVKGTVQRARNNLRRGRQIDETREKRMFYDR